MPAPSGLRVAFLWTPGPNPARASGSPVESTLRRWVKAGAPSKLFAIVTSAEGLAYLRSPTAAGFPRPADLRPEMMAVEPLPEAAITTRVDVTAYPAVREVALLAHASQVRTEDSQVVLPRLLRRCGAVHEHFQRLASRVPAPAYEDDLFASLAPAVRPAVPAAVGVVHLP